jgi:alanyl-tRNA synthetase
MAGAFHIVSEFSVASGVRRIEALTGKASIHKFLGTEQKYFEIAGMMKVRPDELQERVKAEVAENKELRKKLEQYQAKESLGEVATLLASAKEIGGLKVLISQRPDSEAGNLRQLGDFLRDKEGKVVAVLASVSGEKITFLAVCGKEAIAQGVKAGDIIRHVTAICGGKGGGKPDSAMGGGSEVTKLDDALAAVYDFVAEKLN